MLEATVNCWTSHWNHYGPHSSRDRHRAIMSWDSATLGSMRLSVWGQMYRCHILHHRWTCKSEFIIGSKSSFIALYVQTLNYRHFHCTISDQIHDHYQSLIEILLAPSLDVPKRHIKAFWSVFTGLSLSSLTLYELSRVLPSTLFFFQPTEYICFDCVTWKKKKKKKKH